MKHQILADRAVPRYTSYPTAAHFGPSVGADTYAAWLERLSCTDTVSLYLHIPFCAKLCLYCGCHIKAAGRPEPVEAYVEQLIREITIVAKRTECRKVIHLHWGGGTPSILGAAHLREVVARLAECFDLTALREHAIELDPRYVTKELVETLAYIGVNRASLGVQDLTAHVQNAIGRVQPFPVVEHAVALLRDAGINRINLDLMYGLPAQSVDDVRESTFLASRLRPQRFAVFGYAHVPWFKTHQRLIDPSLLPSPTMRVAQAEVVHKTLTSSGYQPVGLDHYASSDDNLAIAARELRLHRNFQGYTTDEANVLLGLGTSAIGRLPQGFVQNASDTGGYSRAISSGQFATARGIALSAVDRIRGRIIEELMCNLSCDLDQLHSAPDSPHLAPFDIEFDVLTPFADQGLVTIDGYRIIVSEAGRPYLRLIAAAFDAYLARSQTRHSAAV